MSKEIKPWTTLKSELVFDHHWYKLRRDHVQLPTGQELDDYFVSVRADVALVFAVTEDQHVVLVRQYKHGIGEILIELPGGVVDEDETSPLAAAKRELLEETGYVSDDMEQLLAVCDNPTKDTNRIYYFLARNARRVATQDLDETENIEVLTTPITEIESLVLNGHIQVAGSVALCLLALRKLLP
jgi:ADP-ribose pyrophosphatase